MKLQSLTLTRGYTGDRPLEGTAKFSTPDKHTIELQLNEDDAIAIVELCAEAIARTGRDALEALTADAMRFTAIEHDADETT